MTQAISSLELNVAAAMLGVSAKGELLHSQLVETLDELAQTCRSNGGGLIPTWQLAAAIEAWQLTNPSKSAIRQGKTRREMTVEQQIKNLATYIMGDIPNEPSQSEGACECASRLLICYRNALELIANDVQPGLRGPSELDHAYKVAVQALESDFIL